MNSKNNRLKKAFNWRTLEKLWVYMNFNPKVLVDFFIPFLQLSYKCPHLHLEWFYREVVLPSMKVSQPTVANPTT